MEDYTLPINLRQWITQIIVVKFLKQQNYLFILKRYFMSTGIYLTKRAADFNPATDAEILYNYSSSRTTQSSALTSLGNSSDILLKVANPNNTSSTFEMIGGLYTLKLPAETFSLKGFYTIYIRPIEIRTTILNCGVLSSVPNIRGIVLDAAAIGSQYISRFTNNGLTGFNVEFIDSTNTSERKVNNYFVIITSNNKVEPLNSSVSSNISPSSKAIRYRLNDNSSLVFCTVTPNSSPNSNPDYFPYIGQPGQEILLRAPFFDTVCIELEMVDYDIESLAAAQFGPSTRSVNDGIHTIYNFNNEIYWQADLYQILDQYTGKPIYEVRFPRGTNIDFSKQWTNIAKI